jgi:ssDNA-binding protein
MADKKKKKFPKFTTPVGTFKFPALHEPSYGTEEYPAPQGVWKVSLICKQNDPAVQDLIARMQPAYRDAEAEGAEAFEKLPVGKRKALGKYKLDPFFELVYDKDTEQPTGEVEFKFKLNASGVYKSGPNTGKEWTAKPDIFDSVGRRLHPVPAIWGGSTGRISFTAIPYFVASDGKVGLSRRLNGVQVLSLVEKGVQTAEQHGFGAMEGGYSFDEGEDTTTADASTGEKLTGEKLAF